MELKTKILSKRKTKKLIKGIDKSAKVFRLFDGDVLAFKSNDKYYSYRVKINRLREIPASVFNKIKVK